jgi:polysaccharide export outer membrane protein
VTAIHVDAYGEGAERGTRLVFDLRAPHTPAVEVTGDGLNVQFNAKGDQGSGEEPEVVVEAFPRLAAEDRVGAEDLLEIGVFELPELQSTVRVKVDGTISLPLLGALPVAGMTVASLEGRLRDILQERYVTNPHVRVLVKEHESRKVSLIGAVAKPGSYVLRGERTMLQMILEAGGLGRDAGTQVVVLRNAGDPREERVRVDLQKLMTQADPSANLRLQPGDIVNVLPDEPVYIYVDGAVKSPGQIETRASRRLTLLQAIIRAGGTTDVANPRQVRVLRKTAGESRQTLIFNTKKIRAGKVEDIYLQDGDIVVIPEALF